MNNDFETAEEEDYGTIWNDDDPEFETKVGDETVALADALLGTRLACDLFSRSLRIQQRHFQQEFNELRDLHRSFLPSSSTEAARTAQLESIGGIKVHYGSSNNNNDESGVSILPALAAPHVFDAYRVEVMEGGEREDPGNVLYATERGNYNSENEHESGLGRLNDLRRSLARSSEAELGHGQRLASFWHSLPLAATPHTSALGASGRSIDMGRAKRENARWDGAIHFVCEVPKHTRTVSP